MRPVPGSGKEASNSLDTTGDSLSKIAEDVYDDGSKSMKIFEANKDQSPPFVSRRRPPPIDSPP
jgi:nucleoid-associated protein YgaU